MDLLTRMVEHHVWLTGEMVRLRRTAHPEQLDEPIELDVDEDEQTVRVAAVAADRADGDVERRAGDPGLRLVGRGARVARARCASGSRRRARRTSPTSTTWWPQERLDDTFVDALCEPAEVFTYGGMIAHVLTFAAHRRTLVALALGTHGVEDLGWGDPMRWVAEPTA